MNRLHGATKYLDVCRQAPLKSSQYWQHRGTVEVVLVLGSDINKVRQRLHLTRDEELCKADGNKCREGFACVCLAGFCDLCATRSSCEALKVLLRVK